MDTLPNELLYSAKDMENYKELLRDTDVIFEPNKAGSKRRPRSTTKWKRIIEPLIHNDSDFFIDEKEGKGLINDNTQKHQKQIAFLPGDVSGLMSKMKLLLAEFLAGNITTRNELVSVLDEIKRRKKLSNKDYNQINVMLSQTKN